MRDPQRDTVCAMQVRPPVDNVTNNHPVLTGKIVIAHADPRICRATTTSPPSVDTGGPISTLIPPTS